MILIADYKQEQVLTHGNKRLMDKYTWGENQYKYVTVMSMQARMWLGNQMKDKDKKGNRCWGWAD